MSTEPIPDFTSLSPEKQKELLALAKDNKEVQIEIMKSLFNLEPSPQRAIREFEYKRKTQIYYAEVYAKEMFPLLDLILESKESQQVLYRDFPRWKPETLRMRLTQATRYLTENLDKDGKYTSLMKDVTIKRIDRERRILLEYTGNQIVPLKWSRADNIPVIDEILKIVSSFVVNGKPGERVKLPPDFGIDKVCLTKAEILDIEKLLERHANINSLINENGISLIKQGERAKEDDAGNASE